jgi:hypothetical protein
MTRRRSISIALDPVMNVVACALGLLLLVILLASVHASRLQVLIPTPMEHLTEKTPVFIECRNNELFKVPLAELRRLANDRLKAVANEGGGGADEILRQLPQMSVQTDTYRVDLTYALLGQFAIVPMPMAKGYRLEDASKETASDWFGRVLTGVDRDKEMLAFLVRDDSFEVFARARMLAQAEKVDVSYELLGVNDPIKFGLGGSVPMTQ